MIINHNMNALNAHRSMVGNTGAAGKSMEKLSSGLRINRAGDDAAGLAISEKMRGQIRGLDQASRNAQDGISMIQTAEGALNETHSILQRMRELSVQSANDTSVATDREKIQAEVDQLAQEITRISETTEFNTQKLLDGNLKDKKFQIGANESQNVSLTINGMDAKSLGVVGLTAKESTVGDFVISNSTDKAFTVDILDPKGNDKEFSIEKDKDGNVKVNLATDNAGGITTTKDEVLAALKTQGLSVEFKAGTTGTAKAVEAKAGSVAAATELDNRGSKELKGINVSNQEAANAAITKINSAINSVSNERSNLGAMQNRLEHTINNLGASSENLTASESRIRDVDMAKEMMTFSKNNILQQAAQAMLAQANQQPQGVLQLLR